MGKEVYYIIMKIRLLYSDVNDVISEELIYDTIIHYNNLRNNLPIPQNLIHFSSKPPDFPKISNRNTNTIFENKWI